MLIILTEDSKARHRVNSANKKIKETPLPTQGSQKRKNNTDRQG